MRTYFGEFNRVVGDNIRRAMSVLRSWGLDVSCCRTRPHCGSSDRTICRGPISSVPSALCCSPDADRR